MGFCFNLCLWYETQRCRPAESLLFFLSCAEEADFDQPVDSLCTLAIIVNKRGNRTRFACMVIFTWGAKPSLEYQELQEWACKDAFSVFLICDFPTYSFYKIIFSLPLTFTLKLLNFSFYYKLSLNFLQIFNSVLHIYFRLNLFHTKVIFFPHPNCLQISLPHTTVMLS